MPKKNPCSLEQPISCKNRDCSSVSTPSQTVSTPSDRAIFISSVSMMRPSLLSSSRRMKFMSNLSRSNLMLCSTSSDEYPLPKSSIHTGKPSAWKRWTCAFMKSKSLPITLSVISMLILSRPTPAASTRLRISSTMSQATKSERERLMECGTMYRPPASCSRMFSRTRSSTYRSSL